MPVRIVGYADSDLRDIGWDIKAGLGLIDYFKRKYGGRNKYIDDMLYQWTQDMNADLFLIEEELKQAKEAGMSKYKVWECKIVVHGDAELPIGFDSAPRIAAIEAVEVRGIKVISCFSGWGGELDETELEVIEAKATS